jgi:hypothetical protein
LELFNQELLAVGTLRGEHDRERIRREGVNLFVSVEEFLECVISFNVWVLSSDHFLDTHFRYDPRAARRKVAAILGSSINSGDMAVTWSSENANTLGSLMAYLNAAASWMKTLPGNPREAFTRPETDLPDFAEDKLRVFPFRHTALWADSDYSSLERLVDGFAAIVSKVSRSNLAAIRNGLDHQRDETGFPKIDQMLAFVAHFREAVDSADINLFFPKEFWLERVQRDCYGREEFVFKDYLSRSRVSFGPTFVHGILGPSFDAPAIIAPGNLLGHVNAEIVFRLRETSVFSRYWDGYPRRRLIPNGHTQHPTSAPAEETNSAS